jgi:hypothetical protein
MSHETLNNTEHRFPYSPLYRWAAFTETEVFKNYRFCMEISRTTARSSVTPVRV